MPNFSGLSQLQWRIILDALGGHHGQQTETQRIAWARGVSRLVARGIIARVKEYRYLKLLVPVRDVKRAAKDAWARDQANGMHPLESGARSVLDRIAEYRLDRT